MPRMEANSVSASRASASSASDQRRRVGGAVILVCASLQVVSAIIATLFLLGVFGDPADCDTFFQDTEARWLLLLGQAIAFILGMWSGVGCLALKTTGEAKMARSGGKALLVPLTPSWIVTCVPTLWAAGPLKE